MKKQLLTLLLLMCSLGMDAGNALIPDMKFRRLDTRDGLSNSQINYIFQDSKGFVWIATSYGLNRYDGYRFRTYYSDASDTTTLRNNYVNDIWEDYAGRLWLRQGMNFCVFDPKTETAVRTPSTLFAKMGIKGGLDRIFIDKKKNFWVKTYDDGLYFYSPKTKQKTLAKYGYSEDEFPKEFWISSFAEYDDLLMMVSSDGELLAADGTKGKVVWRDKHIPQHGGAQQASYKLFVDNYGNTWVMSSDRTYIHHKKENKWYDSIHEFLSSKGITGLPENLQVWDVVMDQRNWLWLATDHEGLLVVDPQNKEIKQFLNNKFDQTSLSENTVKTLMLDKAGNMWIGAYRNGLNQYIEKQAGIKNLELGDINTTIESKDGFYWLGTDNRGIIRYNPETEETQIFDRSTSGFASNTMVSSFCSRDGTLWFGTYNGGMIEMDPNGRVTNYLVSGADDGLLNNNIWSVTEDKWGDIWIGTLGNGVQRLNRKTGKFKTWSSYNTNLNENFMTSVGWIKKGWLIVGHSTYYSLINPVNGKVANVTIPNVPGQAAAAPSTVCVMEDSRELIWQGSMSGCCVYDPKTGWQKLLDMNNGLFGSSVVGMAEDLRHTMWVVTEHGISNVTPHKEADGTWSFLIRSFSTKDGLQQGPYNQRSISVCRDGKVLVGGYSGLDIIDPKLVSSSGNKEHPIFSGLKLFGQQVEVGKAYDGHVILDEALDVCRKLVLRHDENQFTIQLATDKGEMHNTSRFIYQLEGFSDKWIKTEEVDPNITYMSLHHGSYTLHVRMLNEDGTMGENEATLKITITPPLIRNRWLMVVFLLLVGLGIYLWRRRFLKKHAERVELENYRNEIHKKHWMSAMRKKMSRKKRKTDDEDVEDAEEAEQEEEGLSDYEELAPVTDGVKEKTEIVPLLREVCETFKAPGNKPLKISFFPLSDQLEVMCDRSQLCYMLKILLMNSSRFAPANSTVKVFVERQADNAVIRVIDKGVGIPDDVLPHLFEKIENDSEGTNLHLLADIVKSHGGNVRGEGNIGGGTVFTITLPLIPEVIEEAVMMDDENNGEETEANEAVEEDKDEA
jgi:ligand-binding sensor domain-containing protein